MIIASEKVMATPDKPRNAVKFDIAGARKEEASVPQQLKSTDPTLRKFHWFSSSKGRRVVGGAIAVASIGASVYKVGLTRGFLKCWHRFYFMPEAQNSKLHFPQFPCLNSVTP